jgi:dCMP deaminase
MRISWEEYALEVAKTASLRSEDPYMKVGACVLNSSNKIIGVGYNGLASGKNPPDHFWDDRDKRRVFMVHAEVNALTRVGYDEAYLLACTLLPCRCCATLIAAYGIKKVIFKDIYNKDTSAFEIFDFYNIELKQYQ